jgi:zinc and cadmium transporter
MDGNIFGLFLLALLGSVAGLIGGVVFLVNRNWARTLTIYAIPFAAGVLLSVSILHLIPEAVEGLGNSAFLIVLSAFLGSFIFEKYLASMHHHEGHEGTMQKSTIPLVLFGDTIHNFIDGVAIGSAYLISPGFGLVVALSTFLHETPHEIGDFGVLVSRGWSKRKTFTANLLSALTTIPAAFLVYYFVPSGSHSFVDVMLAVSAGIFLYLGASDFIPEIGEHDSSKKTTLTKVLLVILGVVLMYALSLLLPE